MALEYLEGRRVLLKLQNKTATFSGPFAAQTPPFYELSGTILPRPHWETSADYVALGIPFAEVPLRMIHISLIKAVDGIRLTQPKPKARSWKVSSSRTDEIYTVKEKDGLWSCTCVANSNFRKVCKHIKEKQIAH